jgi:DNA-binding CsgD family transcriptional regulator/tetratricopeptide (TPR) repeat protein
VQPPRLLERETQLRELGALLDGASRGQGRVAVVAGEAGIGKTALVRAFRSGLPRDVRVLWGACDPVSPPRPFAPLGDMADGTHADLHRALADADREKVFATFVSMLRRPPKPSVVVLDDLHWADDATLDLLRVIGRRAGSLHVLVIATQRDHDVGWSHPARLALGDLPPGTAVEITLPPLTVDAVASLAAGQALDPVALHVATAGNPFFVSELISAGDGPLPPSVRDSIATRAAKLSPGGRRVVAAAAVLGPRSDAALVLRVAHAAPAALAEATARGLLVLDAGEVAFRHDLARTAVLDGLDPDEQTGLHAQALAAVRRDPAADVGQLAHHAAGADDPAAILEFAPRAGVRAASLGAHREAAAHFESALRHAPDRRDARTAEILERYAKECSLIDDTPGAVAAQRSAVEQWRTLGDRVREGDSTTTLAGYLYLSGEGDRARETAESAVAILAPIEPPGHELARALAAVAQRRFVAGQDDDAALDWTLRAIELAERIGDEPVEIHARTTLALAHLLYGEPTGWAELEECARRADAAGLAEDAARAIINLAESARDLYRYDLADRYIDMADAFLARRELDLHRHILQGRIAELAFARGRWNEAADIAAELLRSRRIANPVRVRALTLLGQLRARRGEADVWPLLDEALAIVGDLEAQEIVPLRAARAEAAWLAGDDARAISEGQAGFAMASWASESWWWAENVFWTWKAGGTIAALPPSIAPYWLHVAGRPVEAARAWAAIGSPYLEAFALADSDDEGDLRTALRVFQGLGARPMERRVAARLHAMGASGVPRGPRAPTRSNPKGLTEREVEVLTLIGAGLRNAAIADRLVVSPKTVDHHVSAILRKLGVPNRRAAGLEAIRLGLKDEDRSAQT